VPALREKLQRFVDLTTKGVPLSPEDTESIANWELNQFDDTSIGGLNRIFNRTLYLGDENKYFWASGGGGGASRYIATAPATGSVEVRVWCLSLRSLQSSVAGIKRVVQYVQAAKAARASPIVQ